MWASTLRRETYTADQSKMAHTVTGPQSWLLSYVAVIRSLSKIRHLESTQKAFTVHCKKNYMQVEGVGRLER